MYMRILICVVQKMCVCKVVPDVNRRSRDAAGGAVIEGLTTSAVRAETTKRETYLIARLGHCRRSKQAALAAASSGLCVLNVCLVWFGGVKESAAELPGLC
jgi:hypothetical protein